MGRLLCFFGGAFLITWAVAKPEADAGTVLTVTLQPGKLGIGAEWEGGYVTRVDKGGQGDSNGIKVGDRITKIDGKTYTERLIDKRIGGEVPFEVVIYRRPHVPTPEPTQTPQRPRPAHDPADPPRPDFKYATELDSKMFQDMVYKVTNGTDSTDKMPPYYPIVMFHMAWCKHCRHALPEFESAAKMVDEQKNSSSVKNKQTWPKFFLLECDGAAGNKDVCDMYGSTSYPIIRIFRDRRSYNFNRPRMAQTFAWWALQVTRPPVVQLSSSQDVALFEKRGLFFQLHADVNKDQELVKTWAEVSLDNIEELNFVVVKPGSTAAKTLPPAPSVSAKGDGVEPLPLEGAMTRESLSEWVSFNQFKPVTELSYYTEGAMARAGFPVIAFLYDANNGKEVKAMEEFMVKAKELRKSRQYLFATVDLANSENRDFLEYSFPLLFEMNAMGPIFPKTAATPRIFAFQGKDLTYWESPSQPDPAVLSVESIAAFLADSWARQDNSYASGAKAKGKTVMRLASGSIAGLIFTIVATLVLSAFCYGCLSCLKAICASDDDADDSDTPVKKNN